MESPNLNPDRAQHRGPSAVVISIAAHSVLFALLLGGVGIHRFVPTTLQPGVRVTGIQVAGASHRTRLVLPPALTTVESRKAALQPQTPKKIALPLQHVEPVGGNASRAQHNGQGLGDAAAGNGSDAQDADPAFPIFSPRPSVTDRKLLPGAEQQIVVDVSVNALGDVTGAALVKGMGNTLDQIVLDTVKTWRFHPATINGNPVDSQAELIFPFSPHYPVTPA